MRAVGADYPADQHQKGVAVLNTIGHGQNKDPFFTGQSDWLVIERCTGYDSGLATLESSEIAGLNVLQKPVDPEALLSTIRELLDRRASCLVK